MRADLEKSIRDRIRNIAQTRSIPSAVLWQNLVLERILVRISNTKHHPNFVLKGGILLSRYFPFHRSTQDLDFSIRSAKLRNSMEEIFQDVCAIDLQDGFSFDELKLTELFHDGFSGTRIHTTAFFGKSRSKVMIDLGFEDFIEPVKWKIPLLSCSKGALFESDVQLSCYPLEFIFAEKLQISFSKGEKNSRMKDFHDLLVIIRDDERLNTKTLPQIIENVFEYRQTTLKSHLDFSQEAITNFQLQWEAYMNKIPHTTTQLPLKFSDLLDEVNTWMRNKLLLSLNS